MGITMKLTARSSVIVLVEMSFLDSSPPSSIYYLGTGCFKFFVVLAVTILIFAIWLLWFFDVFYDLFSGFCWFFEVPDFC